MSYSIQLPGSNFADKCKFYEWETPSGGGTTQRSCYSAVEKISSLANPVSLQHDVMYANAFAAVIEQNELSENETPLALGCIGHRPDREFPLESKTALPLPLIMYPTETCGNTLDKVDMCAIPVLNWEDYIRELKVPYRMVKSPKERPNTNHPRQDEVIEHLSSIPEETLEQLTGLEGSTAIEWTSEPNSNSNQTKSKRTKFIQWSDNLDQPLNISTVQKKPSRHIEGSEQNRRKITHTNPLRKIYEITEKEEKTEPKEKLPTEGLKNKTCTRKQRCEELEPVGRFTSLIVQPTDNELTKCREDKLTNLSLLKLKYQPKLRIEGTWNYLYGGYSGACCFMKDKTSKTLRLFLGKGSLLRAVELGEANSSSIFSYTIDSIWDEEPVSSENSSDPFDELIFQIVPNEANNILGIRRGRTIQIYNTDGDIPDLLESVPNTFYGTSHYYHDFRNHKPGLSKNPLLRGFDFNPTFGPEIISIDENQVVRVCDIYKRAIADQFVLPKSEYDPVPKNYPDFKINDAVGITFANNSHLFYAWGNSVVFMGDRRSKKYSRSHIAPLFDLRNHAHFLALSSQNFFHDATAKLNEYMSCVRRSKRDPYYYVGTTMKLYLMDLRVPNHPVISVNHGLQSALTYMDTYSSEEENFETIVAGSQRASETVCMISDFAHLECLKRPGCKGRNPLLYCYPRHLLNPQNYFDTVVKEGYDFPSPDNFELVKNHFYAWSTGIAILPMAPRKNSTAIPGSMIATSCNNFGDVFWQEWEQRPIPPHKKIKLTDYKLKTFFNQWHKEMRKPEFNIQSRISKNPVEPADCTILLEPLAKEIEKLTRVRDSPFNCFQPDQIRNHTSKEAMIPINEFCEKLRIYKGPRVKGILDVWCAPEREFPQTVVLEAEQVQVKIEQEEWYAPSSPINTIEIDTDDSSGEPALTGEHLTEAEHVNRTQIELETQNADPGENFEDFMLANHIPDGSFVGYSDMFKNAQPFNPMTIDDEEVYGIPHSSLSRQSFKKAPSRSKKSGFL